jgi:hypothetical protein
MLQARIPLLVISLVQSLWNVVCNRRGMSGCVLTWASCCPRAYPKPVAEPNVCFACVDHLLEVFKTARGLLWIDRAEFGWTKIKAGREGIGGLKAGGIRCRRIASETGGQHQRQLYNCWRALESHEHTERRTSEVPLKNGAKGRAWASGTECRLLCRQAAHRVRDASQCAAISSFSCCERLQPHPNLFARLGVLCLPGFTAVSSKHFSPYQLPSCLSAAQHHER